LRGELVGLVGNRQALALRRRFIDHDLNRAWKAEQLARLLKSPGSGEAEDREQLELDATLQRIVDEAPGRVFLLDLHTFSGPGSAFAILDDTLPNREMAMDFPVPLVLGLEEELSGTLASHLTAQGVTVLGFESGQHDDVEAVDGAEAAIWLALDSCGLLEGESRRRAREARKLLEEQAESSVGIVEVLYRHPIQTPNGGFSMIPGFESFQKVVEGQLLGKGADGAVLAPRPGMLLMPLYQAQGEDGFFLVREIRPVWLPISAVLRSWRSEKYLHWLPGVSRDPDRDDTLIVDRRLARFFALRLFHLLGFRREGKDETVLVMTRRQDLRT
jgi:succinylglutamate desuccinylase